MKTAEEKILEITEKINRQIIENISYNEVLNYCSWGAQVGVLISTNDAKKLLEYASLKEDSAGQYELEKLYNWIKEENPKPAITAFTSGLARNIASEIEYQRSLKEDKWISVEELTELLKESKDVLVMCSLIDKSNTCDKMVQKIEEKLKSVLPSPPKTENK